METEGPLILNLSDSRKELREAITQYWKQCKYLRPYFLVKIPPTLVHLRQEMLIENADGGKDVLECQSLRLTSGPATIRYRRAMEDFSLLLISIFLRKTGDDDESERLDAPKNIVVHPESVLARRDYPKNVARDIRGLGAHCDANDITILWTNAPGLQVPCTDFSRIERSGDTSAKGSKGDKLCLTAKQVEAFGIPSLNPPTLSEFYWIDVANELVKYQKRSATSRNSSDTTIEDDTKRVKHPIENYFVVSLGTGFFTNANLWKGTGHGGETKKNYFSEPYKYAQCALLHRVADIPQDISRTSIPFLVRFSNRK
eukprot:g3582.t1